MLSQIFADICSHGKTDVRIDVDLADGRFRCLTELVLGDADGVGHVAAVGVDHFDEFLGHGGGTMQDDGEARKTPGHFLQHIEPERRGYQNAVFVSGALFGTELVGAVGCADGDGQGVAARAGYEFLHFFGTGVAGLTGFHYDFVLNTFQCAQFGFDYNAVLMGVFHHLAGNFDVLLERLG